jgi:hypothetical protein
MVGLILGALGAAAGAVFGYASIREESRKQQEQLAQQKKMAWDQYLLGQQASDTQWELQRSQAVQQNIIQRERLGVSLDQTMDQVNTGLLGQAYGIQNAQIGTAANIGASLEAEGMSGTRGNAAGGLQRAYEELSLSRNIGLQQQENQGQLTSIMTQANQASEDLTLNRASWETGGYNYEAKQSQDAYNKSMAELGQTNFDWQIDNAAPTGLDYAFGMLGGASSGFNLGTGIYDAYTKYFGGNSGSKVPTFNSLKG